MKLDANFISKLNYKEVNFKDIEIEIVQAEDDKDAGSGVGIKGEFELTEGALKQLCSFLRIPYAFTKQLRSQSKLHILPYLQRQLSRMSSTSVIIVSNGNNILSIAEEEDLHYRGDDAIKFDTRLYDIVNTVNSIFELNNVVYDEGDIVYNIFYKDPSENIHGSQYKWGFNISHSVYGNFQPIIGVTIMRMADVSQSILPLKSHSYPMVFDNDFEERWNQLLLFIQNPPNPQWVFLENMINKLNNTTASFREVKESRKILSLLRVDKEDTETVERINVALQWKRINKEYAIKDLEFKPSRLWYSQASTPLKLSDLYYIVSKEGTYAPSNISYKIKHKILNHAGVIFTSLPDFSQLPPSIQW